VNHDVVGQAFLPAIESRRADIPVCQTFLSSERFESVRRT